MSEETGRVFRWDGWFKAPGARRLHFQAPGESKSLCGQWWVNYHWVDDPEPGACCTECRRRLAKKREGER